MVPYFDHLLHLAEGYFRETGQHLHVYGDIGELFGAVTYGIKLHRNFAKGSDGRLGDDFVEIKTITPFNTHEKVVVRLDRHFSRLLIVKIDEGFRVSGRMVNRKRLPRRKGNVLKLSWSAVGALG